MKRFFIATLLLLATQLCQAAEAELVPNAAARQSFINHLARLVGNNYVFVDIAKQISSHLKNQQALGYFDQFHSKQDFAKALTAQLRSINGDLHLNVKALASDGEDESVEAFFNELLTNDQRNRRQFHGFNDVQNLDNGVGYLSLSYFRTSAIELADNYMKLLETADAIIIDLRDNKGGTGEMVDYLARHFFDKTFHTSNTIGRNGKPSKNWLNPQVNGINRPDVPLFILVNNRTASGAEGLSYLMQNTQRATIIGETTIGAAHSGGTWYFDGFSVFVANEAHISAITGKDWEGTGVIPDIKTTDDKSYAAALELATVAAAEFRHNKQKAVKTQFAELQTLLKKQPEARRIHQIISQLSAKKLLNEAAINTLGYNYVNHKNTQAAEQVFKSNTLLFAQSANAFDSYGEVLEINGKLAESVANYQQSVDLAQAQNSGNLKLHQMSLARVKAKLSKQ
ncbi:MAG: S41 family peptidase [Algicola sp.]|nr:S41 family peptidase [Algicola sp.]